MQLNICRFTVTETKIVAKYYKNFSYKILESYENIYIESSVYYIILKIESI